MWIRAEKQQDLVITNQRICVGKIYARELVQHPFNATRDVRRKLIFDVVELVQQVSCVGTRHVRSRLVE